MTTTIICALDTCKQEVSNISLFETRRGVYHSIACAATGLALPRRTRAKKATSPGYRARRKKFLEENKNVNFNPEEKPIPPPTLHMEIVQETTDITYPWAKIKYEGDSYIAAEATVLVKTTSDSTMRLLFSDMRNVRMYIDEKGGLLIRPVQQSLEAVKAGGGRIIGVGGVEGAGGSVDASKKRRRILAVTLGGTRGLNPATPGSKRFFLVEAMLQGGTVKEIFSKAAKLWSRSTGKAIDQFGMISTPSNARDMFVWLKDKLQEAGKKITIQEEGDAFKIQG